MCETNHFIISGMVQMINKKNMVPYIWTFKLQVQQVAGKTEASIFHETQ